MEYYEKVRSEVKLASGDYIDMKMYEPAMRHLLDSYIRAEESEQLSAFDDLTLVQLIVEHGEAAIESLPEGLRQDRTAMAETVENNVRRLIIDEMAINPRYYERMSELLDALILLRKREALNYKSYLAKIVALTRRICRPETQGSYPPNISSAALRALFDNLEGLQISAVGERPVQYGTGAEPEMDLRVVKALALDRAIRQVKKADWRGNRIKQREIRNAIRSELGDDESLVATIFDIVKSQRDY